MRAEKPRESIRIVFNGGIERTCRTGAIENAGNIVPAGCVHTPVRCLVLKTVRARKRTPATYVVHIYRIVSTSQEVEQWWWQRRIFFPLGGTKRSVRTYSIAPNVTCVYVSFSFPVILPVSPSLLASFFLSLYLFSLSLSSVSPLFVHVVACYTCVRFYPSRSVCVTFAACASNVTKRGKSSGAKIYPYSRGNVDGAYRVTRSANFFFFFFLRCSTE